MLSTYPVSLLLHSWLRWVVVVLVLVVTVRAFLGWRGARPWTPLDERLHAAMLAAVDLQFLAGLWLWLAASPFARAFLEDIGTTIHTRPLRFFGLEHPTMMIVAIALLHVGRAKSKKIADAARRHKLVFVFTVIALIVMLGSIPWPSFPVERPLFRLQLGE